jgi:hypothetical protein
MNFSCATIVGISFGGNLGGDGMAAILTKNVVNLDTSFIKERFDCPTGCGTSYFLFYTSGENRLENGQSVIELMRSQAQNVLGKSCPSHEAVTLVWGGPTKGWLDEKRAKAAGL